LICLVHFNRRVHHFDIIPCKTHWTVSSSLLFVRIASVPCIYHLLLRLIINMFRSQWRLNFWTKNLHFWLLRICFYRTGPAANWVTCIVLIYQHSLMVIHALDSFILLLILGLVYVFSGNFSSIDECSEIQGFLLIVWFVSILAWAACIIACQGSSQLYVYNCTSLTALMWVYWLVFCSLGQLDIYRSSWCHTSTIATPISDLWRETWKSHASFCSLFISLDDR